MGFLDGGLASVFASGFGSIYLAATLHRSTISDDGMGGGAAAYADEAVKAQLDAATQAMRASAGYVDTDMRILVLASGVAPVTTDCEITVKGQRWAIANVTQDPSGAYYDVHGRRA